MNDREIIFCLLCFLTAAATIFWYRRRMQKTMDSISRMLSLAMEGASIEENFDESRLSALQTQFAHYLSASAVSARNLSEEKDKIKTLIADISHQTKTPISNLLLHSELLKEEPLSASAYGSVDAIYDQSEKLRFLIDALVKLSRLENGIISLAPRRSPLCPMLQSVQEQFQQAAMDKGLFLKLDPTDISACFDPKWTTEALCNIVDNAVKYTSRGGVTISTVSYELFVRIDVTDTGAGITEEELAKVFSRFYRAEDSREQEGLGIGLYLAREIITGQGGHIKVTSTPGKGSVFSVFLPI